jgi:hypothetical protein
MPAGCSAQRGFQTHCPQGKAFSAVDALAAPGGGAWPGTREIHARRVKISRIAAPPGNSTFDFLGILRERPFGTGIAKLNIKQC